MTSAGTITRRAMTAAAALALWLSTAPPMAAAQDNYLELVPEHGNPGSEVRVVPHIANFEFDCAADFPQEAGWDSGEFTCGQSKGSSTFGSISLLIPDNAAPGPHQVRVQYSSSVVGFQAQSLFADFTVDQPPGESTTDPPTDSEGPTATPTEPPTTSPKPTAPDGSTATHGPGRPDPTTTTTAPAAGSTTDPPTGTGVVDLSRNLPLGFALLATVIALVSAIAMPKLVRTLRRRTPRWVSQNLRVVIDPGIPRPVAPVTRSAPAITVRLAVRVARPRKEGRS